MGESKRARLAVGQLTDAQRARELLEGAHIACAAVRMRPGEAPGGCAWGLELPAERRYEAQALLSRAGIRYADTGGGA